MKRATTTHTIVVRSPAGETKLHVSISEDGPGKPREVFVSAAKVGSATRTAFAVWARLASIALQHEVSLAEVARSIAGTRETPGVTDDGEHVESVWDALGRLLGDVAGEASS